MINILIFGVGKGFENIKTILDNEKIHIVGFVDNKKAGKDFDGFQILSPDKINSLKFDKILIASQFYHEIKNQLLDLGITKEKIISYYEYLDNALIEYEEAKWSSYCYDTLNKNLQLVDKIKDKIELIITGISYAKFGIAEDVLNKNAINLALPRQDLYYDYSLIKYIFKKNIEYKNLKTCIIGLSYYTFEYDLSLTKWGNRSLTIYDKFFNDIHNYENNKHDCERLKTMSNDLKRIFTDEYIENFLSQGNAKLDFDKFWNLNLDIVSEKEKNFQGRKTALQDSDKHYPKTVEENKKVFDKYLSLLHKKSITPICIVFPMSKYYRVNFPERLKKEFYEIIAEFQIKHNFRVLDFFESELFHDRDFCDPFHLNKNGAIKLSKLLNQNVL